MGMTFVMLAGAVDLSVGAIMAFLAIMFGMLLNAGVSGGVALAVTIAAGALLGGGVNGVLIGRLGLSFLLVTLASLTAFTGSSTCGRTQWQFPYRRRSRTPSPSAISWV